MFSPLAIACTLVCINEKNAVSIRAAQVIDGTPCNPRTRDVCVRGECRVRTDLLTN